MPLAPDSRTTAATMIRGTCGIVRGWLVLCLATGGLAVSAHADNVTWTSESYFQTPSEPGEIAGAAENNEPLSEPIVPPAPSPPLPLPSGAQKSISLDAVDLERNAESDDTGDTETSFSNLVFRYIPGSGDDLGMFSFELPQRPKPQFPEASSLGAEPGWGITWLSGPASTDLPARLYQFTLPLGSVMEVGDDWVIDLGITFGWFTDGVNRRPEMFRTIGRAAGYYRIDAETQFAAGFVYLDRDDIPALPVAGVIFDSPERGYRYELVFPRPRMLWRVRNCAKYSRWITLTGELGGGSWAIKRLDRTPDVLTYRDIRVLLGLEFRRANQRRNVIEAGWISNRAVESRTGRGDYRPGDSFLCQMSLEF